MLMVCAGVGWFGAGCCGAFWGGLTEDELLGRREHVQGEGDLVLVVLFLEPSHQAGGLVEQECGGHEDERGGAGVGGGWAYEFHCGGKCGREGARWRLEDAIGMVT